MDADNGVVKPSNIDMKRPKSPERPDKSEEGLEEEEEEEAEEEEEGDEEERRKGSTAGHRAKRERRSPGSSSATMCQVCHIQLNSSAQAQIHYRGKTHQRRLRRLAKAVTSGALSQSQGHPLLGSLPLPGRPLQLPTHAQLEHFLPLRVNSPSPLSIFPNFNTMDPVQKAVINHTFGVAPPKKKPIISCNICHLRFNSTEELRRNDNGYFCGNCRAGRKLDIFATQAEAHYKGHKHTRKLKALESQRSRQKNGHSPSAARKDRDRDRERGTLGGGAPSTESHLKDTTGPSTSSQPAQQQIENVPISSPVPAPPSQPPSTDSASLCSPQPSPHTSPGPQVSDAPSDGPPVEGCGPATSGAPHSDPQGGGSAGGEEEGEEVVVKAEEAKGNIKQVLHCPTCKVTVNSSSQLEAHCSGSKHKQMLDSHTSSQSQRRLKMASLPRPACRIKQRMGSKSRAVMGVSGQSFHCEMCQVSVNSDTQLKQHMNSRRHKERLVGKQVKVKFSPYNKLQTSAVLATKLALQKHLSKALPAGFLTSPLNPATFCNLASGPLALRLPHGPATFIQGPLISPTLFRPAPGPLRATHTPFIFSPY